MNIKENIFYIYEFAFPLAKIKLSSVENMFHEIILFGNHKQESHHKQEKVRLTLVAEMIEIGRLRKQSHYTHL